MSRSCPRDSSLRCHHCGFSHARPCRHVQLTRLARLVPGRRSSSAISSAAAGARADRPDADADREAELLAASLALRPGRGAVLPRHADGCEGPLLRQWSSRPSSTSIPGLGLPGLPRRRRTFQLITQLAGRTYSGRDAPGACSSDAQPDARRSCTRRGTAVSRFLNEELERRRALSTTLSDTSGDRRNPPTDRAGHQGARRSWAARQRRGSARSAALFTSPRQASRQLSNSSRRRRRRRADRDRQAARSRRAAPAMRAARAHMRCVVDPQSLSLRPRVITMPRHYTGAS